MDRHLCTRGRVTWCTPWRVLLITVLGLCAGGGSGSLSFPSVVIAAPDTCMADCICLSQTQVNPFLPFFIFYLPLTDPFSSPSSFSPQVLCNTGGLQEIPSKLLPAGIENLALTKNHFPVIKTDAFSGLRTLRKLSLDGNNITTIKPFAFRGLPKLRELSIQYTPLATVGPFAFAGLQNITTILLSHNKIVHVEEFAFAGTSNVRLILLTNNPMLRLDSGAFSGLSNVEHLILPSGIRQVEPDAFSGLDTVGLLKLAYMDLRTLEPYTFRGLNNIQVLSLQESDLGVISANAFDGLTNVHSLNVFSNKIDAIEELNISSTANVKSFKFQGNHLLETPDPNAMIVEVENLVVMGNHFPCGCHIHALLETPLANGTYAGDDFLRKNFCISPIEVNGMAMIEMDLYSIGRCEDQVTKENLEGRATPINHQVVVLVVVLGLLLIR